MLFFFALNVTAAFVLTAAYEINDKKQIITNNDIAYSHNG